MRRLGRLAVSLVMVVALAGFMTLSAHAGLMGPSVTFNLTNFPGASSITATLGGGLSTVGDVQVFIIQVPTGGGGEWDDFFLFDRLRCTDWSEPRTELANQRPFHLEPSGKFQRY